MRTRFPIFVAMSVFAMTLVQVYDQPEADASVPVWANDVANSIMDGCDHLADVPVWAMGAANASGTLAVTGVSVAAPAVQLATVGASGGAAVAVGGAPVAVGAGAAAGTAAGGGASLLAGGVALAPMVFAGSMCGTIELLEAWHGEEPNLEPPNPEDWPVLAFGSAGFEECPVDTPGLVQGDLCLDVTGLGWDLGSLAGLSFEVRRYWPNGGNQTYGIFRHPSGVVDYWQTVGAGATQTLVMPCAGLAHCGFGPFPDDGSQAGIVVKPKHSGGIYAAGAPRAEQRSQGERIRYRTTVECKRPSDGVYNNKIAVSEGTYTGLGRDEYPTARSCDPGYAPVEITIGRERLDIGFYVPWPLWGGYPYEGWEAFGTVADIALPAEVVNNATSLQCFVVGVTNCPIWDDTSDPTKSRLGGEQGVEFPRSATRVATVVDELVQNAPWPEQDPRPAPTTTVAPTTVPATTTPPTSVPGGGGGSPPPPPGPPVPPSETGWGGCIGDIVGEDVFDSLSVNPVTWVPALVTWMVAPIICAVWWLVVPPDGWLTLVTGFYDKFEDQPFFQAVEPLFDNVWNGGCAPVDFGDPLGDSGPTLGEIDVGMCGNLVILYLWVVILGVATIQILLSITERLANFGSKTTQAVNRA